MENLVFSAQQNENLQPPSKPPDDASRVKAVVSFRDKVLGNKQVPPSREKSDLIAQNLVRVEHVDGNRLLPKVYLDDHVFKKLCSPWYDALVVKLLGKNIGYNTLKERLKKTWKLCGGFDIMDVDNGFYMVKFELEADKSKVTSGGPCMIFDHYLAVTDWSPDFVSPAAKVDRTQVLIRFPGLNMVFYDESFLMALATVVGKPIRVDSNTLTYERGSFARICVEIDLIQPVVGKVWFKNHWYKVEYEGLHIICGTCGCYGHLARNCQVCPKQQPQPEVQSSKPAEGGQNVAITAQKGAEELMPMMWRIICMENG